MGGGGGGGGMWEGEMNRIKRWGRKEEESREKERRKWGEEK